MPILKTIPVDFKKIDQLIRNRKIEKVLDIIDEELLIKQHKFSREDVNALRAIWRKMASRRNNRK
mgnify:FL=1